MITPETMVVSIISAVFASTGFWAFITFLVQNAKNKNSKNSAETQLLVGLAHDRICYLGATYLERGWITKDEFENLNDYLYAPYAALGGNGTAKKIVDDCAKLPIKKEG